MTMTVTELLKTHPDVVIGYENRYITGVPVSDAPVGFSVFRRRSNREHGDKIIHATDSEDDAIGVLIHGLGFIEK